MFDLSLAPAESQTAIEGLKQLTQHTKMHEDEIEYRNIPIQNINKEMQLLKPGDQSFSSKNLKDLPSR